MFAVVFVRKGHLKVTKESEISLVNKHIMEKKETYEKQEITRNRFLWLCVCAMLDRRSFFVWAKHTLWKNG